MKTRLQRYLADCGVASRRACEEMILAGRVSINGEVRTTMPVLIEPGEDVITVDGQPVGGEAEAAGSAAQKKVYLLLNKPKGILVTNRDPEDRKTVGELIKGVKERVFPVGRLDMDSRGALLMTNDGELANRLTHPRYGVEKTYVVEVDGRLGHEDVERIRRGIWLGPEHRGGPGGKGGGQTGMRTEGFRVKLLGRENRRTILEVTLTEARNREVRRVMARIGHPVRDLNRVAIAGKVTLKGLAVGEFRALTEHEVRWLYESTSRDFHDRRRAATQAWYEAKEMEKERKRLTAAGQAKPIVPRDRQTRPPALREDKKFRPRPERKGRKPFVPPSGRNAGKTLGGDFLGRQRVRPQTHESVPQQPPAPRAAHPLGDQARTDN